MAIDACRRLHPLVERWEWSEAGALKDPADALVLDLTAPFAEKFPLFEKWCVKAWQPVCLVSLAAEPGAGEFGGRLRDFGWRHVVVTGTRRSYWREHCSILTRIVESGANLVPQIAQFLGWGCDPPVVEALAVALELIPEKRTVQAWASELGLRNRQQLDELLSRRDLPSPKAILDRLRLARAIEFATRLERPPTRDELAAQFGYSNGDYLGKRARELTGLPLGQLVERGVTAVFSGLKR